jgi:peptidoglycan/LPS O-acetylase OafA/YrhL
MGSIFPGIDIADLLWHSTYEMKRSATHGLALFLAAFPLVGSAVVALWGFVWGVGLQCDENCTGDDWQHTAGASQWTVLTVMSFVVFGSGIALFAFVYRSRPWQALAALALGTTGLVAALSFWGTDWNDELERHPLPFGALACILLSGALAAFLSAPSGPRSGQ